MSGALGNRVDAFVEGVGDVLTELSGEDHLAECVIEAGEIVGGVLASDGRFTTAELEAWLDHVGRRLEPPVVVSSQQLRESDLLTGKHTWLRTASTMFDLLVRADARDGGRRAASYYDLALALAHATAAIDLVPSPDEIAAIDGLRSVLLAAMDDAEVPRPGRPAAPDADPNATAVATGVVGADRADSDGELGAPRPVEDLLAELDALIGLDHVKTEVRRLTSLLRVQQLRAEHGLPVTETSRHLVFVGNPGTGKTTVARLLSELYRSLGVVTRGHLIETDRADLVAGFVGQTATKTRDVLTSALGGTLLVDEAYSLARGGENDFGREAIDTIVKFMEDHRDDLAVVVAGYPVEMQALIDSNPGLSSRFARTIEFPDYSAGELVAIFELVAGRQRYHLDDGARDRLVEVIDDEPRGRGFGNARFVRNVFEQAVALQAVRLADVADPTVDQLTTLVADDVAPV